MDYAVVRSKRKTICIQLTKEGNVVVRVPQRCANAYIEQFVRSHTDWILSHQKKLIDQSARRDAFVLKTGDSILLCGKPLILDIQPDKRPAITGDRLVLPAQEMDLSREAILKLSRERGECWLPERLDYWACMMGVTYQGLKISTARRRWGSCSREGIIRISVYLLFAPEKAIDYVLIHELAHRRHFNHSQAFWTVVAETMPDYKTQRKVLRCFQEEAFLQSLAK